jgi:WD40 repeat protein
MKTSTHKKTVYKNGRRFPFLSFLSISCFFALIVCLPLISPSLSNFALAAERAWLGVQVKPVTGINMRTIHMQYGRGQVIHVSEVVKGSPAEQMDIRQGDVILSVNYKEIRTPQELVNAVTALSPGDKIVLLISRTGEKARFIEGKVGKAPDFAGRTPSPTKPGGEAKSMVAGASARMYAPTGQHRVLAVALSPDGKYVIAGGDMKNSLKIWDIFTGKELWTLKGHEQDRFTSVAFSPDGKYALSGSFDKTAILWDVATGKEVRTFRGHTAMVLSVAFSPDGKYAATGSRDNTIKLWDVASGSAIRTFSGHSDGVKSIAFSPDGRYLLSGSYDKTIKLWEVASGSEIRTYTGHAWQLASVAFTPDGKKILSRSGDRIIKIWSIDSSWAIRTFSGDDVDASGVRLGSQMIVSGDFSPDGRYMLTTGRLGDIKLWDIASGKAIKVFKGHTGWVPALAFSKDMKSFISGGYDGTIRRWDIESGKEIAQFISLKDGEWIALTAEGYYNSSLNAHKYLNIQMGNKVYGIDQFYDVFYRPDIVAAKLRGDDISGLITLTIDDALRNPPPTVEFSPVPPETDRPKVNVCYQVQSTGGGIGEVRVFHNGKLIQSDGYYREVAKTSEDKIRIAALNSRSIYADMRSVNVKARTDTAPIASKSKGDFFKDCKEIDAISGENEVSVSAFNGNNTVQSYMETTRFYSGIKPGEPRLYILSIGIDRYAEPGVNLKYAVKDAKDLEEKIKTQSVTLYKPENIHYALLTDAEATKTSIVNKISELSGIIKPEDSFILFVAGHGVLLQNQYYMLTHDFNGQVSDASMISSNEIVEMSKKIKSLSQLFIFDTCHAGGVDTIVSGLYDARMSVLAKKMGLHIYASASDKQTAMDGYRGNGLFTHTLLDGLNNNKEADRNKDGRVTIVGLGEYSKKMTTNISRQIGNEQTPLIINFGKDSAIYKLR